jgi:hypothetical protein
MLHRLPSGTHLRLLFKQAVLDGFAFEQAITIFQQEFGSLGFRQPVPISDKCQRIDTTQ